MPLPPLLGLISESSRRVLTQGSFDFGTMHFKLVYSFFFKEAIPYLWENIFGWIFRKLKDSSNSGGLLWKTFFSYVMLAKRYGHCMYHELWLLYVPWIVTIVCAMDCYHRMCPGLWPLFASWIVAELCRWGLWLRFVVVLCGDVMWPLVRYRSLLQSSLKKEIVSSLIHSSSPRVAIASLVAIQWAKWVRTLLFLYNCRYTPRVQNILLQRVYIGFTSWQLK